MNSTQTQATLPPQIPMPRERGVILKNLADFQTELARVAAGFVPGMEDWAVRNELPLHVFSDLRIVQDFESGTPAGGTGAAWSRDWTPSLVERCHATRFCGAGDDSSRANGGHSDRERYFAMNFLQEVQASDSCASILFEAPDMPWSYDIADETQHVRYGQKWLPTLIKAMEDPRSPDQVKADAENWRATVLTITYHAGAQPVEAESPQVA